MDGVPEKSLELAAEEFIERIGINGAVALSIKSERPLLG
jgi:hypothetical protein